MIRGIDIGWAAGFLEGEGWFGNIKLSSPKMGAGQNDIEPLLRLQRLFGGKITLRKTQGFSKNPIHFWSLDARRSAAVMMTLYSLLSARRQNVIKQVLGRWRAGRNIRAKDYLVCIHGHDLIGDNAQKVRGRVGVRCRTCINEQKRMRRTLSKSFGLPLQ